jgi:hypothetical protein
MVFVLLKTESVLLIVQMYLPVINTLLVYWNLPAEWFGSYVFDTKQA